MIPRYTRKEMEAIWSEEERLKLWLEIELRVIEARSERGEIPTESARFIREKAKISLEKIREREAQTQHDLVAFVEEVASSVGEVQARYFHYGLTSSDILDTAFAIQILRATDLLLQDLDELLSLLKEKALSYRHTVMVGRTHGVHAEPITLGLKFARWYALFLRRREFLMRARETISYGKLSGAVGTYAHIDPDTEQRVLSSFGLKPEPVASQVVPRDRHAEYFCALALLAGAIEEVAVEIRSLQRTEIREWEEPFSEGQKGSSAMPHKRNPILSENLTGLSRYVRSLLMAVLENIALWDERDISHSSVERIVFPDATVALDFALKRLTFILSRLEIYPDRMAENLHHTRGLIFAQAVMLKLVDYGFSRREAYEIVQRHSMRVWKEGGDLLHYLLQDPRVCEVVPEEILRSAFRLEPLLRRVDGIFLRLFPELKTPVLATTTDA
jgi:adenylosuccinate lyase